MCLALTFERWNPVPDVRAEFVGIERVPNGPVGVRDILLDVDDVVLEVDAWHGAQVV